MAKKLRRAFTIVELVIVIAVIAILAAVLIPTFTSLIQKANVSNDTSNVKNMNTFLSAAEATDGKAETMYDAVQIIKEGGYDLSKLTPTGEGYDIVWDQEYNRLALVNDGNVIFSDSQVSSEKWKLWIVTDEQITTDYSVYLSEKFTGDSYTATAGVDVGDLEGVNVTINAEGAKDLKVRTNGGTLTVNAPDATVSHYEAVDTANITAVADHSYYEYGTVELAINVTSGHIVLGESSKVNLLSVCSDVNGVKITSSIETIVVLDAESAGNIQIESSENLFIDNQTSSIEVTVPQNVSFANQIASVDDLKSFSETDADGFLSLKDGYYKLAQDITVDTLLYVPENGKAVLDLNGHAIISQFVAYSVANYGDLTILDSSGDNSGRIYNTSTAYSAWSHDAVRNFGMLTIYGGTFGDADSDKDNANMTTNGAALRNLGTAVINGGNFTCTDNYAYYHSIDAVFGDDVSDYEVREDGFVYSISTNSKINGYSYAIRSQGELVINDANVYGNMNGGVAADAGSIVINGGKYVLDKSSSWYVLTTGDGTITIYDGYFQKETGNNGGLLGGYNGMPSWDASNALAANGFYVYGGTFILKGETVELG